MAMNRFAAIRRIFGASQNEMARIAGVNQSQISRYEHGLRDPSLKEMERIRAEALKRGLPWSDSYFFQLPPIELLIAEERTAA